MCAVITPYSSCVFHPHYKGFHAGSSAAAEATLPFRAWASLLSGRTRKNRCTAHHLSAIYNSLMQVPFVTWETFIGDNEGKQWDASLFLSSPPQPSFISPSHKADSLLLTPAAATLKIDNKVSGWKPMASCRLELLRGVKSAGQPWVLMLSWRFHLSGVKEELTSMF